MDSDEEKVPDEDPPWKKAAEEKRKAKKEAAEVHRKAQIEANKKKKAEDKEAAAKKAADKEVPDKDLPWKEAAAKKSADKEVPDKDLPWKEVAEERRKAKKEAAEVRIKVQKEASIKLNADKAKEDEQREADKKKVLVPIANGTDAVEAVVTIDVLRRAYAKVTVASVEKKLRVDASNRVKIVADALISDCAETVFDLIALPGGPGAETLRDCKTLENMVKKQAAENRLCAAICAAPAIAFGSWDLLKGRKATCYPSFMEQLPSTTTATESRVEKDNNVVTSRGPGTAIEYAIELVEQLYNKKTATEISEELIVRSNHGEGYDFANLNPVSWAHDGPPKILVLIADGTEEMEVVIIVEVLRKAGAEVVVASVDDKEQIVASRDVKLVADMLLDKAVGKSYDLILLPGELGDAHAFHYSKKLIDLLKKQKEANKPYGAICASPALVLEYHGLLEGKKATVYPPLRGILSDPGEAKNRVVVDGYVATSQGLGTSMEYALVLVEKFFGKEKATELAKEMVFV